MTSAVIRVTRRRSASRFLLPLAGLAVAVMSLWPFAVMLLDALRPNGEILASPATLLPHRWDWSSFGTVLHDPRFLHWLRSSVVVAVASTAIVLLVAVPAAYYAARVRFLGRGAFLFAVLVTQMFSPTSLVVGVYREFFELGLVNTYLAVILTNAAFNLAFAIWILHGFFAAIPRDIEEAAQLDGSGRAGILWRVMLPLVRPALVTATVFTFIAAWNEYVVALTLMRDDALKPLTVGINSYVTGYEQQWNNMLAASLIAVVPVVVLFISVEKHLAGGMLAGSVK
ncbi:carbohydrate ABC transporter permease [Dactylosporangium sp. CA-092794]|uniref:carbohydrate ABC transporter permease n=1 Tax=Dactylosporangium sp. CA-092794 TaxID=3239929 RepID=UPI003D92A97A